MDKDFVVCPVCKREFKVITKTHFKVHGYSTKEQFLEDYPGSVLVSESYRVRNAEIRKAILTTLNKSESQRKKASERAKIRNQNPEFRRRISQSKRNKKHSEEEKRKISESLKRAYSEGRKTYSVTYDKKHKYVLKNGVSLSLRSFMECRAAKFLEINKFNFEYETLEIEYVSSYDNKTHKYLPDFYLPDYNLVLEVKPEKRQSSANATDKMLATVRSGYNYMFVGYSDLDNYESLLRKIITLDAK